MKNKFALSTVITATVLLSSQAWSVALTTPGDYALSGTTVAANPELAGTVLEDLITDFSFSGAGETITGTIQNRVIRSSVDNTIDFSWRIKTTSGNGDISAFRLGGFDGFALDADWRIDGLGDVAPTVARYLSVENGTINFLFTNEVGYPDESMFFYLDTDALHYDMSGGVDMLCADSDCVSPAYQTFAPSSVPVPAAAWLFGSALLGLVGVSRKK